MYKKHNSFETIKQSTDNLLAYNKNSDLMKLIEGELDNFINTENNKTEEYKIVTKISEDLFKNKYEAKFRLTPNVVTELNALESNNYIRYLTNRYKYEVYPQELKLSDYPPCVQIEPTSVCNFRCVFCYQTDANYFTKKSGKMGSMNLDTFKMIIDQIHRKVEIVTLASRGEPLVAKNIVEMLDYTRDKFLSLKINTNASLLTDEKCHAILRNNVQTIVFSADEANKEMYEKLRVNGNFEKTIKNIKNFISIKNSHYPNSKIITRVSGVKFSDDQNISDMENVWGDLVDQIAFVNYNPWEDVYNSPSNNINLPCSDLWRRIFAWWDGQTNPCDVDFKSDLSPGKISNENNISKIWNSQKYNFIRNEHLQKKEKI